MHWYRSRGTGRVASHLPHLGTFTPATHHHSPRSHLPHLSRVSCAHALVSSPGGGPRCFTSATRACRKPCNTRYLFGGEGGGGESGGTHFLPRLVTCPVILRHPLADSSLPPLPSPPLPPPLTCFRRPRTNPPASPASDEPRCAAVPPTRPHTPSVASTSGAPPSRPQPAEGGGRVGMQGFGLLSPHSHLHAMVPYIYPPLLPPPPSLSTWKS